MHRIASEVYFSASDLVSFAECQHLSWLDRLNLDEPMTKTPDDEQAKLVQAKGFEHEYSYLHKLRATGARIVEVPDDRSPLRTRAVTATTAAIRDGAEVIYQAALQRGNLMGHADFLVRTGDPDAEGRHAYEVVDTKLARTAKGKFVLQLCFYSDLLRDITGKLPGQMHVELGNGTRQTFRVADYFHYYQRLLRRMLGFISAFRETLPPYPVPCGFCTLCHWRERCETKRFADDHLSAVANITRQQTARLETAKITTLRALARLPPGTVVPKLVPQTLEKLREQAALQLEERETGCQRAVVLQHPPGEIRGFALLPKPDPGDLFFDMEGDPLEAGGLEYLFGVCFLDGRKPQFKCFWAHDRDAERTAFIEFMDFVAARLSAYPGMHIYHYAPYEKSALKRLMTSHGVREADVDNLLRNHKLVDLYQVVRQGLRVSKPGYSIKQIESFYAPKREGNVQKATESIVVYERWRETSDPALLESIRSYNEDDCRSTWQLREWLLTLRPPGLPWYTGNGAGQALSAKPARAKSEKTIAHEAALADFHSRLIGNPQNKSLTPDIAELIHHLLDFHRRADKPGWWALFDRQSAEFDELLEDPEVVAGMYAPTPSRACDDVFRYRFPAQEFKAKAGDRARSIDTLREVTIVELDEDEQTIDVKLMLKGDEAPPSTLSLSLGAPISTDVIRNALFVFAEDAIRGSSANKAALDFLARRIPDIKGVQPGTPIINGHDPLAQTIQAISNLNASYLFIQGPPGSGKTYTGSHVIAALLQAGKRVAVSANSHKVINNLLDAVDRCMTASGASYTGMKKITTEDQGVDSAFIVNVNDSKIIEKNPAQLVAGTAWLLARPGLQGAFDYLFLDEAGQVSLANMVAMSQCAKNIVLLGDQMQLGQPIQGSHPGRSGESVLDYLLDGGATIAPERGIFLEKTYRMHPDVCRFISEAFYDSRLQSDISTHSQTLILDNNAHPALKPTGIVYLPVTHNGCSQRSEEEAAVVNELVRSLLTQRYRDKTGAVIRLTLNNILVVAPYNMQVNLLKRTLPAGARVGTVDKFQGQEAEVVIVSMTTSSQEYMPRFMDFLFSKNRLNVALSRARCLSIALASDDLLNIVPTNLKDFLLHNAFCQLVSYAHGDTNAESDIIQCQDRKVSRKNRRKGSEASYS